MLRRIALALSIAALAAACNNNTPPPAPATPPPPPVKTDAERVAWYQNCWKLYNEKNWDGFGQCYAETATSQQPGLPAPLTSRAAIIESDKGFAAAIPDRHGDVQLVLQNGAHIASLAAWGGTHEGPLPGPDGKPIAATHKKIALLLGHVGELDAQGGHMTREAVYLDNGTMLSQIGVAKTPSRPATMPAGTATVVSATKSDTETKNVAAFRATADAFSKGDPKAFGDLLADDYVGIDATMPKDQNKKAAIAGMQEYKKGFPDAVLTITSIWAAGDYVAAEGTFNGTNTGDVASMGLKKTGKKVSVPFFEVIKFENGKAKTDWTIFDSAVFAAQLGMK